MKQYLGVGSRSEDMTARDEFLAKLPVVVNLAIEGDHEAAVRCRHRLRTLHEVDDGETAVTEEVRSLRPVGAAIGTAMCQRAEQPKEDVRALDAVPERKLPEDAAHQSVAARTDWASHSRLTT